jgi:hypothetical protein
MERKIFEKINVGDKANDGNADSIRDAMIKINNNFEILGNMLGIHFEKVESKDLEKIIEMFK